MSVDPSTPRSRRAILASALGGLGAVVAARLVKPEAASAAPGDAVLVDAAHTGTGTTGITSTTTGAAIAGTGGGQGVTGSSAEGVGVWGASTDTAVSPFADPSHRTGVVGIGGDATNMAPNTDETGVYGWSDDVSQSSATTGVWGDSFNGTGVYATGYWGVYAFGHVSVTGDADSTGTGVYGFAGSSAAPNPPTHVAVAATAGSTAETALQVSGKVKFSRSGRTYIASGSYARKITMAGVTASSYVIATLQTRRTGVYVHAVVPGTGYFYIYLNKAVTATTYVGYLVIN